MFACCRARLTVMLCLGAGCHRPDVGTVHAPPPHTDTARRALIDPQAASRESATRAVLRDIEASYRGDLEARLPGIAPARLPKFFLQDFDRGYLEVRFTHHGTVEVVRAFELRVPVAAACAGEACARAFLVERAALLDIEDPAAELELLRQDATPRGDTVVRYRQVHEGLPVHLADLLVVVRSDGTVRSYHGHYVPDIGPTPALPVDADLAADTALGAGYPPVGAPPELWWVEPETVGGPGVAARPAWSVRVAAPEDIADAWIDAQTGDLLGVVLLGTQAVREIRDGELTNRCNPPDGDGNCPATSCAGGCPCVGPPFDSYWLGCTVCGDDGVGDDPQALLAKDFPGCTCSGDTTCPVDGRTCEADAPACGTTCNPEGVCLCVWAADVDDWYRNGVDRNGWHGDGLALRVLNNLWNVGSDCTGTNAHWYSSMRDSGSLCDNGVAYLGTNYATRDLLAHENHHGVYNCEVGPSCFNPIGGNAAVYDFSATREHMGDAQSAWVECQTTGSTDWLFSKQTGVIRSLISPAVPGNADRWNDRRYDATGCGGGHENGGIGNKAAYLAGSGGVVTFDEVTVAGQSCTHVGHAFYYALRNHLPNTPIWTDWRWALLEGVDDENARGAPHTLSRQDVEDATDAVGIWGTTATIMFNETTTTSVRPHAARIVGGGRDRFIVLWPASGGADPNRIRWRVCDDTGACAPEEAAHPSTGYSDAAVWMFRTCAGCGVADADGCCGRVVYKQAGSTSVCHWDVDPDDLSRSAGTCPASLPGTNHAPAAFYWPALGTNVYAIRRASDNQVVLVNGATGQVFTTGLCTGAGYATGGPSATLHTDRNGNEYAWVAVQCQADLFIHLRAYDTTLSPVHAADQVMNNCFPGSSCAPPPAPCLPNNTPDSFIARQGAGQPMLASNYHEGAGQNDWIYIVWKGQVPGDASSDHWIQRFRPASASDIACDLVDSDGSSRRSRMVFLNMYGSGVATIAEPSVVEWLDMLKIVYADGSGNIWTVRRALE